MKSLTIQRVISPVLSLSPMVGYMIFAVPAAIVSTLILTIAMGGDISLDAIISHPLTLLLDELCLGLGAVCGCVIVRLRNKTKFRNVIRFKSFDLSVPIMLLIFGWAAGELCDHFGGLLLSQFMTVEPNRDIPPGWVGVVVAVIGAPIFEELIFRYAAIEFPRGAYPVWLICLANGIFFAVVHFYNIQGFLNVFIGGVAAAYIYCKTRNIWYTMLEHAIHNALCLLPFDEWNIYYEKNGFVLGQWWWVALNAVLLVITLLWYFLWFRKKYTENYFEINRETGLPAPEIFKKQKQTPVPQNGTF